MSGSRRVLSWNFDYVRTPRYPGELVKNSSGPRIQNIPYYAFDIIEKESFKQKWTVFLCAIGSTVVCLPLLILAWWLTREPVLIPPDPVVPQPPSPSPLREFSKAAVCTDGPPCSKVGRDILAEGGGAVDAAIASLFCNGLVNGQSMGLGGGFIMTLYIQGKPYSLIARETAPAAANPRMFVRDKQLSRTGGLAIGVPGELKGYHEAWKRFGKLPWKNLVEPTVKICHEGYHLSQHQYDALTFRPTVISEDPIFREMFINPETNDFYKPGSIIRPSKICDTLSTIMLEGGNAIHNGSLTNLIVEDINALGGLVTKEDLNSYQADWVEPVSITLSKGEKVYSSPPPSSGPLLLYILSILDGFNMTLPSDVDSEILTAHRTIEAFKFAFARRTELGDPKFVNISELMQNLTSPRYAMETRLRINDSQTYNEPRHYGAVFYNQDDHGTAHISILSQDGDAVSVTSTINLFFGAGSTSPSTGIVLNSVMDDFSTPGIINYFNLPPSPNNFIQPGKRPLSSACPTVVADPEGNVRLVVGASGGTKITTVVSWIIMRNLWFGENLKEAVDASRIHHQLEPMEISYEYGVLQQVIQGLQKLGHRTTRYRERGSIICAVAKKGNKVFGNADFRKGGEVYGLD